MVTMSQAKESADKYPLTGAATLLATAVMELGESGDNDPILNAANKSHSLLMNALVALNHSSNFLVTEITDPAKLAAEFILPLRDGGNHRAYVRYRPNKKGVWYLLAPRVDGTVADAVPLPIAFDYAKCIFHGTEVDKSITASPGQPHIMRSAVTVIVEAVCKSFTTKPKA
jgi:hypothetical protein